MTMTGGPGILEFIATQLAYLAPLTVACLVGILLALWNLRRARRPAVLALSALVVMLVAAFAATVVQGFLIQNLDPSTLWLWSAIAFAEVVLNAGALVLLCVAVFVGRPAAAEPTDD
jgi:hypothetical protein